MRDFSEDGHKSCTFPALAHEKFIKKIILHTLGPHVIDLIVVSWHTLMQLYVDGMRLQRNGVCRFALIDQSNWQISKKHLSKGKFIGR